MIYGITHGAAFPEKSERPREGNRCECMPGGELDRQLTIRIGEALTLSVYGV